MNNEIKKNCHDYAWEWFKYHAEQRLRLFQFYFIVFAALMAGFIKLTGDEKFGLGLLLSIFLFFATVIFWRFDTRNTELIKIGEEYLIKSESQLAEFCGEEIKLSTIADQKNTPFAQDQTLPHHFYSYRQLVTTWYFVSSLTCVAMFIYSVCKM